MDPADETNEKTARRTIGREVGPGAVTRARVTASYIPEKFSVKQKSDYKLNHSASIKGGYLFAV